MRGELANLHEGPRTTMIFVTHDQIEAMTLASRVVILNSGFVEQVGTPLELYFRPRKLFVATFIGSPQMNLLEGTVTSASANSVEVRLARGGSVTSPAI